jgi:hypothetical protein
MTEHESSPSSRPAQDAGPGPPTDEEARMGAGPSEEEDEPVTTGTLFIMILFLMALAGLWALMYLILLGR